MYVKPAREYYIRPCYRLAHDLPELGVQVYVSDDKPAAIGFYGKQQKPDFHFTYRSVERRDRHIAEWLENLKANLGARAARKAERKAKLQQPHGLQVGDVLVSSWGYDQTNIDHYEVTALVGRRMVELRPIGVENVDTGDMTGRCAPVAGKYIGEAFRRQVGTDDQVKVRDWGCYARKLEFKQVGPIKVYRSHAWSSYH